VRLLTWWQRQVPAQEDVFLLVVNLKVWILAAEIGNLQTKEGVKGRSKITYRIASGM
jgi:hypothetical protein